MSDTEDKPKKSLRRWASITEMDECGENNSDKSQEGIDITPTKQKFALVDQQERFSGTKSIQSSTASKKDSKPGAKKYVPPNQRNNASSGSGFGMGTSSLGSSSAGGKNDKKGSGQNFNNQSGSTSSLNTYGGGAQNQYGSQTFTGGGFFGTGQRVSNETDSKNTKGSNNRKNKKGGKGADGKADSGKYGDFG